MDTSIIRGVFASVDLNALGSTASVDCSHRSGVASVHVRSPADTAQIQIEVSIDTGQTFTPAPGVSLLTESAPLVSFSIANYDAFRVTVTTVQGAPATSDIAWRHSSQ